MPRALRLPPALRLPRSSALLPPVISPLALALLLFLSGCTLSSAPSLSGLQQETGLLWKNAGLPFESLPARLDPENAAPVPESILSSLDSNLQGLLPPETFLSGVLPAPAADPSSWMRLNLSLVSLLREKNALLQRGHWKSMASTVQEKEPCATGGILPEGTEAIRQYSGGLSSLEAESIPFSPAQGLSASWLSSLASARRNAEGQREAIHIFSGYCALLQKTIPRLAVLSEKMGNPATDLCALNLELGNMVSELPGWRTDLAELASSLPEDSLPEFSGRLAELDSSLDALQGLLDQASRSCQPS